MGRAEPFIEILLNLVGAYATVTYCREQAIFRGQKWSKGAPFCSMYGDVLLYPLDDAGFATKRF